MKIKLVDVYGKTEIRLLHRGLQAANRVFNTIFPTWVPESINTCAAAAD